MLREIMVASVATVVCSCSSPMYTEANTTMPNIPTLRVARPSNNLPALLRFYEAGLGLDVLHQFEDHDGFDGVMLGKQGSPYHLEFTHAHGHDAGRAPGKDNLLVFYLPDHGEWEQAVRRMTDAGFESVASFNPYWEANGRTFEDPDGYRIVLQNAAW